MTSFISRKEICEELDIDQATLRQYESFLDLPLNDDEYSLSVAKAIGRIHDLVKQGFDYSEIRSLGAIAEKFKNHIPSLKAYEDLSPTKNLKEAIIYYQELLQSMNEREQKFKEKILELEDQLSDYHSSLDENNYLKSKIERYETQMEEFKQLYANLTEHIAELESKIAQYEVQCNDLYYQLINKDNQISKLESQLEGKEPAQPISAIDIETLLKKKEREFEIKHQRKIFDLKKQVETIVAQKEQEWLQNPNKS